MSKKKSSMDYKSRSVLATRNLIEQNLIKEHFTIESSGFDFRNEVSDLTVYYAGEYFTIHIRNITEEYKNE